MTVYVENETGDTHPWSATRCLERWVGAAVAGRAALSDPADAPTAAMHDGTTRFELGVRLVSPETMRALNRQWRGRDAVTNVLSFPCDLPPLEAAVGTRSGETIAWLGDLVLCAAVLRREADAQHKAVAHHAAHLVVHGVLHLLGDDHASDADADAMEAREIRILSGLGVADPYGHPVNE